MTLMNPEGEYNIKVAMNVPSLDGFAALLLCSHSLVSEVVGVCVAVVIIISGGGCLSVPTIGSKAEKQL